MESGVASAREMRGAGDGGARIGAQSALHDVCGFRVLG